MTHNRAIQSFPSCFNLWLWRLLEIGSNSLTPACYWAPTGVSSSISGGWSWRRHRWLGQTLTPFLCFLSDTLLKSLSTSSLHGSASFLGFQWPDFKICLFFLAPYFPSWSVVMTRITWTQHEPTLMIWEKLHIVGSDLFRWWELSKRSNTLKYIKIVLVFSLY